MGRSFRRLRRRIRKPGYQLLGSTRWVTASLPRFGWNEVVFGPWREPRASVGEPIWRRRPDLVRIGAVASVVLGTGLVGLFAFEGTTSFYHAHLLANRLAPSITYQMGPGPSSAIVFPDAGPYNERLGYTRIPEWTRRLDDGPYRIERQAQASPEFLGLVERGLFPIYREKVQAGLELVDREGRTLFHAHRPERVFEDFDAVPAVVVETLLFIENRSLLNPRYPHRNPAVEWRRLGRASLDFAVRPLSDRSVPGASTLATQIEKFRHSPAGLTHGPREKLRQMASATVRTYLDGPNNVEAQRRIVVVYLNSVPLAGAPGYGEVFGIGDGLWAWYGVDLDEVSGLLATLPGTGEASDELEAWADAYRKVLSLLVAQRRPTWHLTRPEGRAALAPMVDGYLRLLAAEGVITPELRDAALSARPVLRARAPVSTESRFTSWKAANTLRFPLVEKLQTGDLYRLERLDLTVRSSLDAGAQAAVEAVLTDLKDPSFVASQGLGGPRLLARGDPARVEYAVTVYERTEDADVVRVETDTFEGPFNLNRGAKLDLGSTAKLRTLVHYLEVIEDLHARYSALEPGEIRALEIHPDHTLARWTADFVLRRPEATRKEALAAALDRRYRASPAERFHTGGGIHTFRNFDRVHDGLSLSVRDAFAHSVNLPFIRIMRDLVRHYMYEDSDAVWRVVEDGDDPRRRQYLERFADREGREFVATFYRRYPGSAEERTRDRILEILVEGRGRTPLRLAWTFRSVLPHATAAELEAFLRSRPGTAELLAHEVEALYRRTDPAPWGLHDLGYLSGVHPLELQVASHLISDPTASLAQVIEVSREARLESYAWLFRSANRAAQDQRIRVLIEEDAFREIHRAWARLGYPFDALVPSYATAIGSSADRPESLAELVGIMVNGGVRRPVLRILELHFAEGTPYETVLRADPGVGEPVVSPEVAEAVLGALEVVVSQGTGRRLAGGLPLEGGGAMAVAGKTGTGDHTLKVYAPGGRLLEERPVNRTATFVFVAGDRFYGTVTAVVSGENSGDYTFTSSLTTHVLQMLGPALTPLFEGEVEAMGRPDDRG